MSLSSRPTYSQEQLSRYFKHIHLPQKYHPIDPKTAKTKDGLAFLVALQKYQLSKVPFENLSLHYSKYHSISLDPQDLYVKVVERGYGGYCMENNCFFGTVLRSLGYDVYSAGARVSNATNGLPGGGYEGWSHMVNIVTVEGERYMVDVGFGSNGPIHPLPLLHDEITYGIGPQEVRLLHTSIEQHTDATQKVWVFEHRNDPQSPWTSAYSFTELEFLPPDYTIMNFYTSTSRTSFFTYTVICMKTVMEGDEVVGTVTLFGGDMKKRISGKTEHLESCETEEQRVKVLEKYFGIVLGEEEKNGIQGMVTELKG
ncbi:MAG: hypothetical protein M1812_004933 [Candelaria pacifica]|nr:MAG: hypothetical protein M1812_004933 [Candelaria pacifica]